MKHLLMVLLFSLLATSAFAQQAVGGNEQLEWQHDGVNLERFELRVDGGAPIVPSTLRQDTTYRAALPAMTPGVHEIAVAACNISGCSAPAAVFVRVVVLPGPVTNVRIVPIPGGN